MPSVLAKHYALNHGLFLGFAIAVRNSGLATSHNVIHKFLSFVAVPMKKLWG
jgi:hypothetical protein